MSKLRFNTTTATYYYLDGVEDILEQLLMRTADFAKILVNFSHNVLVKKGSFIKKPEYTEQVRSAN